MHTLLEVWYSQARIGLAVLNFLLPGIKIIPFGKISYCYGITLILTEYHAVFFIYTILIELYINTDWHLFNT